MESAEAIQKALNAGRQYGYGNVISWLATEWATILRDCSGLSEESEIKAVSSRSPYRLPPKS